MSIHSDIRSYLRGRKNEIADVRKKVSELENEKKHGHRDPAYIQNVIQPQIRDLQREISRMKEQTLKHMRGLADERKTQLIQQDRVRGEDLTDDYKLFTCGVKLTDRDIEAIIDRNSSNPTMVQLALRYADENKIHVDRVYLGQTAKIREIEDAYDTGKLFVDHWIDTDDATDILEQFFQGVE